MDSNLPHVGWQVPTTIQS